MKQAASLFSGRWVLGALALWTVCGDTNFGAALMDWGGDKIYVMDNVVNTWKVLIYWPPDYLLCHISP